MINEKFNDENEKLTIEKLKLMKGFENIDDKEADEIIKSLNMFSTVLYGCFQTNILKTC